MHKIMKNSIWLDKNFLSNDAQFAVGTPSESWKEQYVIYNHAESILKKNPNEHDLACAIFQLNRAVDFREKLLNKHYNFKKIQGMQGKKQHEIMVELGIIKPLLKTKLDKIRNTIMHSADCPVPIFKDVMELAEFTWYFLKSTDFLVSKQADMIGFNAGCNGDNGEWAEVEFDTKTWQIRIRGYFFNSSLSDVAKHDTIELTIDENNKFQRELGVIIWDEIVLGPEKAIHELIKKYFTAL
jgi:hypothetical protein